MKGCILRFQGGQIGLSAVLTEKGRIEEKIARPLSTYFDEETCDKMTGLNNKELLKYFY
jgi:hypothetical protein